MQLWNRCFFWLTLRTNQIGSVQRFLDFLNFGWTSAFAPGVSKIVNFFLSETCPWCVATPGELVDVECLFSTLCDVVWCELAVFIIDAVIVAFSSLLLLFYFSCCDCGVYCCGCICIFCWWVWCCVCYLLLMWLCVVEVHFSCCVHYCC